MAKLASKIFNLATSLPLQLKKKRRGQKFPMERKDDGREFISTRIVRGKLVTLASSTADSSRLGIRGMYTRGGLVRRGCLLGVQRCWGSRDGEISRKDSWTMSGGNISSMNKKETDKMAGRKNGII